MMEKIVYDSLYISSRNRKYFQEFFHIIQEIAELDDVKRLAEFPQHMNTSRLEHSLNVAFYGFLICKKLKLDYKSAARAGLLHDLFLYDWRSQKQPEGSHVFAHPVVALRNAMKNTDLNCVEQDAILNHMWPLSKKFPKYLVSYIVSASDKYCTCYEVCRQIYKRNIDSRLFNRCW